MITKCALDIVEENSGSAVYDTHLSLPGLFTSGSGGFSEDRKRERAQNDVFSVSSLPLNLPMMDQND